MSVSLLAENICRFYLSVCLPLSVCKEIILSGFPFYTNLFFVLEKRSAKTSVPS